MMSIGFRCEECGTLLDARPDSPGKTQCPHCGGNVRMFEAEEAPRQPEPIGPSVGQDGQAEDRRTAVFRRLMPWLCSSFLHGTVMLMLMFTVAVAVPPPPGPPAAPSKPAFTPPEGGKVQPAPVRLSQDRFTLKDGSDSRIFDGKKTPRNDSDPLKVGAPKAQSPRGVKDGKGGAGGGRDDVQFRTIPRWKVPRIDRMFGGGNTREGLISDKEFIPAGPRDNGIFKGDGSGDPWGPVLVIGEIPGGGEPRRSGESGRPVDQVVFVIDHSGSVLPAFDRIIEELKDYVSYLEPTQSFHVVFFARDGYEENPARRLVSATDENKLEAARFLRDVRASGWGSSPIPGLQAAFKAFRAAPNKPGRLLYLLTDGDFETSGYEYRRGGQVLRGNEAVVAWLRDNNADKAVQVNVVIVGDKPSAETEASMRTIAGQNGGVYHFVEPK